MALEDFNGSVYTNTRQYYKGNDIYVPERCIARVDRWLMDNSDQTWVATRHLISDMNFQRTQVHSALERLSPRAWNSESRSADVYLNPYSNYAEDRG